jgi:hypothetical protein
MDADETVGESLLQLVFELWVDPEMNRRRLAGELPADFELDPPR